MTWFVLLDIFPHFHKFYTRRGATELVFYWFSPNRILLWVLFQKYSKSQVPLRQLFSAWLHKVGKLNFKVRKSEIGKFLGSFRYHKYTNFSGVPCQSSNPKFLYG
jgi:hypothetical protein